MGKICSFAAAIVFLTGCWAVAGNFEVLAGTGVVVAPTPIHIKPGTIVKADFKSNLRTSSDADMESDAVAPEKVSGKNDGVVLAKPAISYKERTAQGMAPPPRLNTAPNQSAGTAQDLQESTFDLEADLEKDLVLSPPPSRTDDSTGGVKATDSTTKAVKEKAVASEKKLDKKKAASPSVKHMAPPVHDKIAGTSKPIHKVRPTANSPWFYPAGNYQTRSCPVNSSAMMSDPRYTDTCRKMPPMAAAPRLGSYYRGQDAVPPPSSDRIVRDGVTIKLAPAAAGPSLTVPEEDSTASDILSTAAEIIGMPFAFISSFF